MSLSVYVGPMFAGKSTEGQRLAKSLRFCAANTVVWLHNGRDTRSDPISAGGVYTHNGPLPLPCDAVIVVDNGDLSAVKLPPGTTHVFVDEVQFYKAQNVIDVVFSDWVIGRRLHVYAFGLLTRADLSTWDATVALMARADEIVHLRAVCEVCGRPATATGQRPQPPVAVHTTTTAHTDDGSSGLARPATPQIKIGGQAEYRPLCTRCFTTDSK